jgi:hypothetical protein
MRLDLPRIVIMNNSRPSQRRSSARAHPRRCQLALVPTEKQAHGTAAAVDAALTPPDRGMSVESWLKLDTPPSRDHHARRP